jgi:hypothetical protein
MRIRMGLASWSAFAGLLLLVMAISDSLFHERRGSARSKVA